MQSHMPKYIYRILAEITWIIHAIVFLWALFVWLLWEMLFWLYTIGFLLWIISWVTLYRYFVTDMENWLRVKSWQDISYTKQSFLWHWGKKIFWRYTPSNKIITWFVVLFYLFMGPIWIYLFYIRYLQNI